ncbi:MAG TPA: hypothetical protein VN238_01545 [Solirubrobacteraceae bacterium]|nr:hypothetical protein [Solirubrobacteraceae bacterium]
MLTARLTRFFAAALTLSVNLMLSGSLLLAGGVPVEALFGVAAVFAATVGYVTFRPDRAVAPHARATMGHAPQR